MPRFHTNEPRSIRRATKQLVSRLKNFCMPLALWIPQHWHSMRNCDEKPKVAQHCNRKLSVLRALVHLLPTLACIALVALNLRTVLIGSVSTVTLTALQFAAKGLEILIQGSITIVVLAVIRSQLLQPGTFPFGGVLGPYRVTDVSYLWSWDLWGALTARWNHGWCSRAILLLLPASVILTNLVGPSVAILVRLTI
jgi:hypothetical protein